MTVQKNDKDNSSFIEIFNNIFNTSCSFRGISTFCIYYDGVC